MTKSEIEKALHEMIHERLLGDGPWPLDKESNNALHEQLVAWGLIEQYFIEPQTDDEWEICRDLPKLPDGRVVGGFSNSKIGAELELDALSCFLGHHELFEIPGVLHHEGVLDCEQADVLEAQCLDSDGDTRDVDDLVSILEPVLVQLYLDEFPEHTAA